MKRFVLLDLNWLEDRLKLLEEEILEDQRKGDYDSEDKVWIEYITLQDIKKRFLNISYSKN